MQSNNIKQVQDTQTNLHMKNELLDSFNVLNKSILEFSHQIDKLERICQEQNNLYYINQLVGRMNVLEDDIITNIGACTENIAEKYGLSSEDIELLKKIDNESNRNKFKSHRGVIVEVQDLIHYRKEYNKLLQRLKVLRNQYSNIFNAIEKM